MIHFAGTLLHLCLLIAANKLVRGHKSHMNIKEKIHVTDAKIKRLKKRPDAAFAVDFYI